MRCVFYYLSRYQECYEKLVSEIRSTFQSGKDIRAGPALASCKYLRACIDESLRISPPVGTTLWRDVPRDGLGQLTVDGTAVPEGTRIGVNIYSVHYNEAYFPAPWTFSPERFLEGDERQRSEVKAAFAPFSIGYRACAVKCWYFVPWFVDWRDAGKPLAYLETSVTVAKTLWYFELRISDKLEMRSEREKVFHMLDQQGSDHEGPLLMFEPRRHAEEDLRGVVGE
jgi:hypothetical protein